MKSVNPDIASGRSGNQRVFCSTLVEKRSVLCRKCYEMPLLDFDDFRSGRVYVPRHDLIDVHVNPYTGVCYVMFEDGEEAAELINRIKLQLDYSGFWDMFQGFEVQ